MCVLHGEGKDIAGGLLFRTREHDFIPPLFPAPPEGTKAQRRWRRGGELPWSGGVDRFGEVSVREGVGRLGVGSIL